MRNSRARLYKVTLVVLTILLLIGVSATQQRLNKQRATLGLTTSDPLDNAPPVLAFTTVALGGFRGLIANVLWLRAADLQEEGKYFEMVQLADWITKLQPHFTSVWVHQAWNMTYNISIKFTDPHDRWLWVLRGIELLRDQGLRYNPKEPLMYRELAWFFQHKLGHFLDDAHVAYKSYWAEEMNHVLDPAGSRPNFEALIHPKTPEEQTRASYLTDHLKMDPKVMQEVDQHYGPLEWRLPESSAVYWGYIGLKNTRGETLNKDDFITLRRVIFQSMLLAFQRGRLIYPIKGSQEYLFGPNLEIVKQTNKAYEEQMDLEPDKREHISVGHRNFLSTAVYWLYENNRLTAAREWFDYLKKKYPKAVGSKTLDDFALGRITEDIGETDPNRLRSILEGLLQNHYLSLAMGDDDRALGMEAMARKAWIHYNKEIGSDTRSQTRMGLPPLDEIKKEVLGRLLGPNSPVEDILLNQLRTRLNLPLVWRSQTNAPAASTNTIPPLLRRPSTNQPAAR